MASVPEFNAISEFSYESTLALEFSNQPVPAPESALESTLTPEFASEPAYTMS